MKYCEKCGSEVSDGALFCEKCGHKVKNNQQKTKFCKNCGEKIAINAIICPNCGVKLKESFYNAKIKKHLTKRNIGIVAAIICIAIFLVCLPSLIDFLTPYKDVDSAYVANPVFDEKVRVTGTYIGKEENPGFLFVSNPDVVQVGNNYLIIRGFTDIEELPVGSTVTLEGRFYDIGESSYHINSKLVEGYWFTLDNIISS